MDRVCAKCSQSKSEAEFYRSNRYWCRECCNAYARGRRTRKREPLPPGQRRCSRCREIKPEQEFVPRSSGGWKSYCRPCDRIKNEEYRKRSVENPRGPLGSEWASWRETGKKMCAACERDLPLSAFRFQKSSGYPYGYCRECGNERHKKWIRTPAGRAAQKRDGKKRYQDPKWAVRHLTGAAIKLGLLVRQPCEVCGVTKVQAHHTDYNKPLEVQWLCAAHHSDLHKGEN